MTDPRIEPYDRAAAMADAGTLTVEDGQRLLADYHARVENVIDVVRRTRRPTSRVNQSAGATLGFWIIGAAAIGLLSRLSAVEWIVLATATAMVICFRLWLGFMSGRFKVRRQGAQIEFANARSHMAECLEQRLCPECDYPLGGIHPNLSPVPDLGAEIGPRACPECGAKWPLVPGKGA